MFHRSFVQTGNGFGGFPGSPREPQPRSIQLPFGRLKLLAALLIWAGMLFASNGVAVTGAVIMIFVGVVLLIAGFGLPGSGMQDYRNPSTSTNV